MCDFCTGNKPPFNSRTEYGRKRDAYPGIEVCVEDGEMSITASADTYEPGYQEADFKINFCPMCGERLSDFQ